MFQHIGRWAWQFRLLLHPMAEVSTCPAALRSNGACPKQTVAPPIPPSISKNMSNSHGSQMPRWKKSIQNRIGWASGVVVLVPVDGLFPGPSPGGRPGRPGRPKRRWGRYEPNPGWLAQSHGSPSAGMRHPWSRATREGFVVVVL